MSNATAVSQLNMVARCRLRAAISKCKQLDEAKLAATPTQPSLAERLARLHADALALRAKVCV